MPITYALGDLQGCYDELCRLLDRIGFDPAVDRLWFTGDLVNRGPDSLRCLRFVRSLGDAAVTVLGNHDLHLLAAAYLQRPLAAEDTLKQVIDAADSHELLDWLRRRPLAHYDSTRNFLLIHAGLPPQWDLALVLECARNVERMLRSDACTDFFAQMYSDHPDRWTADLSGMDYYRFVVNCLTRMRYCDPQGRVDFGCKGPPGTQADPYLPWFEIATRRSADLRIVFGHWSTLGPVHSENIFAIDSGCVWGGKLTALTIEDEPRRITIDCTASAVPA